jgi:unsaturated rhamnogalacturonyl hydrolase
MLGRFFDTYAERYSAYKGGDWCYEDGCIYRGLMLLDGADRSPQWFGHLKRLVDAQVDEAGGLAGYVAEDFNIDNILSGRALLFLHERTGEERYLEAAHLLARQLARHPRIDAGNYWHKLRYPHQVWLDGLYMGLPFQIEYGLKRGHPELVGDAVNQMRTALDLLRDPETGLYRHGYDASREQSWSDPETGRSPALWSRAIGWMAMALVDIIELVGPQAASATGLDATARDLARRLAKHQRPDGRWNQVTDLPDFEGNYPESSATAMFAYFYLMLGRLGLAERAPEIGLAALRGLLDNALRPDGSGQLALHDICHVAGLGGFGGHYREGTAEYYLSEPRVADDAKGVGPLMMSVAEMWCSGRAEAPVAHSA